MARARIVVGTTAVGGALDGPIQDHGPRSYSRNDPDVKMVGISSMKQDAALKAH